MIRSKLSALSIIALAACAAPPSRTPSDESANPATSEARSAKVPVSEEAAKEATTTGAQTGAAVDTSKLAKVTRTPDGEAKKGLKAKALDDAIAAVKIGTPWDKTTKDLLAKIGKPTYTMTPGRNSVAEDWIWVVMDGEKCSVNGVSRSGGEVDQKMVAGSTYFRQGHGSHIAEEIRSEGAGYLHVCEGTVTAGPKN